MRPFVATLLKCTKCGSTELPQIIPNEVDFTLTPADNLDISKFRNYPDFLNNLICSLESLRIPGFNINESDVCLFAENGTEQVDKIQKLLTGIDIINGQVICGNSECRSEHQINGSILKLN